MGRATLAALLAPWLLTGCVFFGDPFDRDGDGTPNAQDCAPDDPLLHEADGDGDGVSTCGGDCDDRRADRSPGLPEACNGRDDDCDGRVPAEEIDGDGDGQPTCGGDCAPEDASIFAGAPEACDGADSDCDGVVPDDERVDEDGDGAFVCGDCDDDDPAVNPTAEEACDGRDTDCSGEPGPLEVDFDLDGAYACADCDDQNPTVHPGAQEVCDGRDTDCDGALGPDEADPDGDGFGDCQGDCAPDDPWVSPGALERCNGEDDDCDGAIPLEEAQDTDGDGAVDCADCAPLDPDGAPAAGAPLPAPTEDACEAFGALDTGAAEVRIAGTRASERMGASVALLGDLDGDGSPDFGVGAPRNAGPGAAAGRLLLVDGSDPDTLLGTISGAAGDLLGHAAAPLGDLDGDGRGDFAVALPGWSAGAGSDSGAVAVFLGAALTGGALDASDAAALLQGEFMLDAFGAGLAAAGDVDRDGVQDLLVGAPGNDDGGVNAGKAYLFSGARLLTAPAVTTADAVSTFLGDARGDALGDAVAGAGDVDGDGCDDVLLGAQWAGSVPADAGRAYLWSGAVVRGGGAFESDGAFATFLGQAAFDRAGARLSGAGDVDGDGLADVLIGAPNRAGGGAAYLHLGASLADGDLVPASAAAAEVVGTHASARIGDAVASAGDVDGDGRADLLVGAAWDGAASGAAAVVPGCRALLDATVAVDGSESIYLGPAGSRLGAAVAGAGDVDGDGLDDLLVGGWGWSDGVETGAAWLFSSPFAP